MISQTYTNLLDIDRQTDTASQTVNKNTNSWTDMDKQAERVGRQTDRQMHMKLK